MQAAVEKDLGGSWSSGVGHTNNMDEILSKKNQTKTISHVIIYTFTFTQVHQPVFPRLPNIWEFLCCWKLMWRRCHTVQQTACNIEDLTLLILPKHLEFGILPTSSAIPANSQERLKTRDITQGPPKRKKENDKEFHLG
jgi:hypothetical protein